MGNGTRLNNNTMCLQHDAILCLGPSTELRVELPDWHGMPRPEETKAPAEQRAAAQEVIASAFVKAEEHRPSLTGTERAHELNRALRKALHSSLTSSERAEAAARESSF